jgi:uncharacterized cupin superfamily protein
MSQPVVLHEDAIRPQWVIEGNPQARSKRLAMSADGTSWIAAWSCNAGRFNWHYVVDETVHILSGEVFVTDEKGRERRLRPGDTAFFPAGTWPVAGRMSAFEGGRHCPNRSHLTRTLTGRFWHSIPNCRLLPEPRQSRRVRKYEGSIALRSTLPRPAADESALIERAKHDESRLY